ncbi:MAG: hypothetical protein SGI74_10885 [Oligoflexia bacterium]|nr:hypothetical protein [Oligoflexia bacterium]
MAKNISLMAIIMLVSLVSGGGCNMFGDLADKSSDEAILDDVENLIDAGLWNDAVLKWQLLSSTAKSKRENKLLLASAYAGRGGLDILRLISAINSGGTNFFTILMKAFRSSQYRHIDDQILAEAVMVNIGATALLRTVDENIFTMFVEFAKLGTIMAAFADTDADNVVDTTFNNCTALDSHPTYKKHIVTGLTIIIESLAATGSTLAGSSVSNISANCTVFGVNFCSKTDISNVTAAEELSAETLMGESHLAIGLAATTSVNTREFTTPVTSNGDPCAGVAPCLCP